jgi:hypothetical protein
VTQDERYLLQMAKPDVTLQAGLHSDPKHNPHFYAAACCVENGWLEALPEKDKDEFQQATYRITPAGLDALQKSTS